MEFLNLWNLAGIVSLVLLVFYWGTRNSVWGGLTAGVLVGVVGAIGYWIFGDSFSWTFIKKTTIVGVLSGFFIEIFFLSTKWLSERNSNKLLD